MASVERASSFRHEGHVFFIYDHTRKTEEDDPKDAILYFYPGFVEVDVQIGLVGGIIGLVDFCLEFLPQCMPSIVKLSGRHFALLQHEDFIIGLGGSTDTPDACLTAHMQFVWSTFVLYQGSLSALRKRVSADCFLEELKNVWDYYLPLRQIQDDALSQAFQVLPYVQLHKSNGHLFLHASHILQRSLTHKGVLAGALFNKTRVLCTQLSNSLTRQFLLLMSQSQFPSVEANSVLELPGGVRLLHIYLPRNEYAGLGYRRKKAYVHSKPDTKSDERASPDKMSGSAQPSLSTPDYRSAQHFFTDGVVSSMGGMVDSGKSQSFDEGGSSNRSSGGREGSGSVTSPSGGPTSGTDSEVFLDTLSDMMLDAENQLKLSDIKQVECVTSGKGASHSQLHQSSSCSDLALTQISSNSLLNQKSNNSSPSQDSSSPSLIQNSSPSLIQNSSSLSLSQDSSSPSLNQDSSSPTPSQDSSSPSLSQDSSSPSQIQGSNNPALTQNSNNPSPIQDSPSVTQESNSGALLQTSTNPSPSQDSSSAALTQESNNPVVTQDNSNPSLIRDSNNPSPSQDSNNPALTQDSNSPALTQDRNNPSLSEDSNSLQIKTYAEHNTGASEENKPQLKVNQSVRDLSLNGETPEEDSSHHVEALIETPHSCYTDSSKHDTSSGDPKHYGTVTADTCRIDASSTDTGTQDTCTEDSSIKGTSSTDTGKYYTHSGDTNRQEMSSEDISRMDTSSVDRNKLNTYSADTDRHIISSNDTTNHDTFFCGAGRQNTSTDDTRNQDTCPDDTSSYDTSCTDTSRHENGDSSRQNATSKDTRNKTSDTDARKHDKSNVDTSSCDTSCTNTSSHEHSFSESIIQQDRIFSPTLHLNKNRNKGDQNESVMAANQEHCGGLESNAYEVTVDLKVVTKATDSVSQGVVFTQSYSDSVDSSETDTASSHFDNSLSSDQQQNKEDSKVNSCGDGVGMISVCHDNTGMMGTDSGELNSISLFQNGRVTSPIDLHDKDSNNSLKLQSEVKISKFVSPNGEITELRHEDKCDEDSCTSLSLKHKSKQNVANNIHKVDTSVGVENGLSDSASMSVSDLANEDSRSQRLPLSPELLKQTTFNVAEILAQNKELIDASLEAELSGDESSTQSSSELKQDDREVSSYSLAYSEVSANKDRLTFEFVDSEFSEGGLVSPVSLQLSPVTESSGPTMDDLSHERSGPEPKGGDSKTTSDHKSGDVGKYSTEWDPQKDGLEELTLYAQGHSDTLLVLLVSHTVKWNKLYINSLWKSCLPHLAELDFQVKDAERHAKDDSENVGAQHQYLKYDSFSQNMKGSALLPVTSLANEIVDSSIRMHESFSSMPDLQEITYRSHSACCYGQRMVNTETYFQIGLPRMSAGICPPNDKTFCLDQMAEKILQNDK